MEEFMSRLREGEMVAVDTVDQLREVAGGTATVALELSAVDDDAISRVAAIDGVVDVAVEGTTVTVACENRAKAPAIAALYDSSATVRNVRTSDPSLEDVFAAYTEGVA